MQFEIPSIEYDRETETARRVVMLCSVTSLFGTLGVIVSFWAVYWYPLLLAVSGNIAGIIALTHCNSKEAVHNNECCCAPRGKFGNLKGLTVGQSDQPCSISDPTIAKIQGRFMHWTSKPVTSIGATMSCETQPFANFLPNPVGSNQLYWVRNGAEGVNLCRRHGRLLWC